MSISEISDNGSPHQWANLRVNNLTVDGNLISTNENITNLTVSNLSITNNFLITKASVSQTGSPTSSVTINVPAGTITTSSNTYNSTSLTQFTVNCSPCKTTNLVMINYDFAGTNSSSTFVFADNIFNGSFRLNIRNDTSSNITGIFTIRYFLF